MQAEYRRSIRQVLHLFHNTDCTLFYTQSDKMYIFSVLIKTYSILDSTTAKVPRENVKKECLYTVNVDEYV